MQHLGHLSNFRILPSYGCPHTHSSTRGLLHHVHLQKWLPLIAQAATYGVFYKWFNLLKERGHSLLGFYAVQYYLDILVELWD